jgi:hypothetical protein
LEMSGMWQIIVASISARLLRISGDIKSADLPFLCHQSAKKGRRY